MLTTGENLKKLREALISIRVPPRKTRLAYEEPLKMIQMMTRKNNVAIRKLIMISIIIMW